MSSVVIDGNAFWKDNSRFYIRGVDYQPGGSSSATTSDPLADAGACSRDVKKFVDLGVNTIRVYSVDPSQDHSSCMKTLRDNDIYLILDVNNPYQSINRAEAECSYNAFYMKNVFDVIDEFAQYDNVFGFFAGNEVINDEKTTGSAKYVKAVVRDMKKYIKARSYRTIPVGYSAADIETNRKQQIEYFTCGDDENARVDFWGHNDYSWCGDSNMQTSGYDNLLEDFKGLPIPIFFSEFGCNSQEDRPFTEIQAIYSTKMSSVLSGGLVYEYSQEANDYGLVKISSDESSVTELGSYTNLKQQYASVDDPSGDGGASSNNSYPSCPSTSTTWLSDDDLPSTPSGVVDMINNGAGSIVSVSDLGYTSYKCYSTYDYPTGSSNTTTNGTYSYNSTSSGYNSTSNLISNTSYVTSHQYSLAAQVSYSTLLSTTTSKHSKNTEAGKEKDKSTSSKKHSETSSSHSVVEGGQIRVAAIPTIFAIAYNFINLL
ncbi:hypothetical protein DASC09_016570 [Saccharomycopsis crataegensis]|uniref:1,3-beta-glucanosyltransferase n=1 Tax=Saccharomycopsis crataegensis TaxID=43959 RepID=A0AAV5QHR5_9ASCO|nr:hypothetical protein DASC09_016570 [Saccharomycopsis crataegensis]